MDIVPHHAWTRLLGSPPYETRHIGRLLTGLAIAVTVPAGIYAAAAALATTLASTFATEESDWRAPMIEFAPAASPVVVSHADELIAERNSLGMRTGRRHADAMDIAL